MWIAKLRKALRLLRHPVYWRGLCLGIGASIEHEGALRPLGVRSVVDAGANKGQFSLLARTIYPEAVIHAFEPLEGPLARFRRLFAGDGQVTLHPVALGEEGGTAIMHLSGRADSSSLLAITERQASLFPGTASIGTHSITVVRGDDVLDPSQLPRPLLLKIDVQGYEVAALNGMTALLYSADYIYLEISFVELYSAQPLADEVISFLKERGFRLKGIYNVTTGSDGSAVQADALFGRFTQ